MDSLMIGDFVRAGNNHFSRVFCFVHLDRDMEAEYYQFHFEDAETPLLEVTPDHMVFLKGKPIRASQVKIGDTLGNKKVADIKSVKRIGAYAPVTESGDLFVSGILASSFADVLSNIPIKHSGAQNLFAVRRLVCKYNFAICENETYTGDGFPEWLAPAVYFALSTEHSVAIKLFALFAAGPIFASAYAIEKMLLFPFLAIAVFGLWLLFAITKRPKASKEKQQ